VGFFSATFLRLLETYGFLYRNRKNVIYTRTLDEIKTENIRRMRRIRAAQEEYF
jgi:intein/homing endonuclease